MRSEVAADLELQGTVEGLTLAGDVRVLDARYTGNFDTGGIFALGGDETPAVSASAAPPVPLAYDVRITSMSTLRVDNDLMRNMVASGDLQLRGTYERPLLFGRVDVDTSSGAARLTSTTPRALSRSSTSRPRRVCAYPARRTGLPSGQLERRRQTLISHPSRRWRAMTSSRCWQPM
jgi:hypothetical protein